MDLTQLITVYGPLGIGWVAAAYIGKNYVALQNQVLQAFMADTQAKMALQNAIDNMSKTIERTNGTP